MKKLMMIVALALAGVGGAQGEAVQQWEYANYYEAQVGSQFFFGWQQGIEQDSWGHRRELLNFLGCPNEKTYTNNVMLFDCLGKQGWELVNISRENVPNSDELNYLFKRAVQ